MATLKLSLSRCVKLLYSEGLISKSRRNYLIKGVKNGDRNAYLEVSYRLGFLATVVQEEGKRINAKN